MRAALLREYGPPEKLELTEVDRPVPLPTEVLVRVRAASVNPVEAFIRSGRFPLLRPPVILGWDVSGTVEEVVPGVTRFQVGDEVYGMPFFPRAAGAYAQVLAAPSRQLARKPARLDHTHAAALPLVGLTAWQGLVDAANVQPGHRVLVHAAAGGVGHLAVQIAKHLGATVVATASAGKIDFVRGLGADEVIDYRKHDFAEIARDIDVVFELVGGDYGARSIGVLRPGGILLTAVERTNAELAAKVTAAGRRFVGLTVEPDGVGLERLAALVDAGKLQVHVSTVVPFADIARAHRLLENGGVTGKIVVALD